MSEYPRITLKKRLPFILRNVLVGEIDLEFCQSISLCCDRIDIMMKFGACRQFADDFCTFCATKERAQGSNVNVIAVTSISPRTSSLSLAIAA